ncbi:MAG: 23S rRNA (uracil(1939)-C(5))-methyltransferase RlmD [Bacteroidales bacterium]|nr:23S rRNA (uracil(1939)-C(5))-methyltransferase RlmD [Bacteroidales bacterium]
MRRRKPNLPVFENVEIIDAGSEGKAVARVDDKVIFIPYVVPGDVVDVKTTKKKKSFFEGKAIKIHKYSDLRVKPLCSHFGVCGGCKWQNLSYEKQLFYKQKQVFDNFTRIGKFEFPEILPIIPSENQYYYRNKIEFTFSNKKWLTDLSQETTEANESTMNGLGFHIPGMYNRIVDIDRCFLQKDPTNEIRLAIKKFAIENNLSFYNINKWEGLLRNLIIRNTSCGELMVIMAFRHNEKENIKKLMDFIAEKFPEITSLMYVINEKKNDDLSDQKPVLFKGKGFIVEKMAVNIGTEIKTLEFKIGPLSFFQTNSLQANKLYETVLNFAEFKSDEIVYDLYTGTGTIANYISFSVKKVIAIEYVESSVEDAKVNTKLNKITNIEFFAGVMEKILNEDFFEKHGKPDVIITDPPRAGMHDKVIKQILQVQPERIVYVSCNPATQARDIALMDSYYSVEKVQPVDMFPQTHHVENVVLLKRKFR